MWNKNTVNSGPSIFVFSFTMYCNVSLSLRKSCGGSFASTYKLSPGDVRKAPRHSRRPWWCIASSAFKYEILDDTIHRKTTWIGPESDKDGVE